jgi:hypothetical protein
MAVPDPEAVLITGLFGSGKSSVAVEMADILEKTDAPFAIVDLDFLAWFHTGNDDGTPEHRMRLQNLAPVLANYLAEGVRFFVLAVSIRDPTELNSLRTRVGMPLKVVRLTVPWPEIERRLRADVTSGRQDDLREAASRLAASEGEGLEDLTVANDRPIRQVATEILEWLGWQQLAKGETQ